VPTKTAVPNSGVPDYTLASSAQTSTPNRPRWKTSIVLPVETPTEEAAAAIADAARWTLRQQGAALAVIVFCYDDPANVGGGYDRGRAVASRDGHGWTGNGSFAGFVDGDPQDKGKIYLTLGSTLESNVRREVDLTGPIKGPKWVARSTHTARRES